MPILFKIIILFLGVGFLAYLALGVFEKNGKNKPEHCPESTLTEELSEFMLCGELGE